MSKNRLHRGKRVDNGNWVFGYYFAQKGLEYIKTEEGIDHRIRKDTVGQYVRTVDDVDYYELDVVEHYMDGCEELPEYYLIQDIRSYFTGHLRNNTHIKHMGNIIDNPERKEWVEEDF